MSARPFGRAARFLATLLLVAAGLVTAVSVPAAQAAAALPEGFNGSVDAIAVASDGTQYVAGDFTRWAPQTGGGAVVDASSGVLNQAFPRGSVGKFLSLFQMARVASISAVTSTWSLTSRGATWRTLIQMAAWALGTLERTAM